MQIKLVVVVVVVLKLWWFKRRYAPARTSFMDTAGALKEIAPQPNGEPKQCLERRILGRSFCHLRSEKETRGKLAGHPRCHSKANRTY